MFRTILSVIQLFQESFYNSVVQAEEGHMIIRHTLTRHDLQTFFALMAVCEGNAPATDALAPQNAKITVSSIFDIFFFYIDSRNKLLRNSGIACDLRRHNVKCNRLRKKLWIDLKKYPLN